MATVDLRGVWKTYPGEVHAVRGFDLAIGDGEFVVLVGPSGCGKSTTLRMIAGLEDISRGEIAIDGRVVNGVQPKDRDIAMVFQNYALYPHMSVAANMGFALKLRGMKRVEIERRVDAAAESLGITQLLGRKPRALSGGQRQRVAVGRAIVREPKVFLFDEPLSNLDAKLRVETRGELKALHQRLRTTTVYVTHDQEEAMTLGDRIVVMADADVQQVATPFEAFRDPVNRFVAAFIGTPPMAFFEGRIERGPGGPEFVTDLRTGGRPAAVLRVHADHVDALSAVRGPVVLGVRPTSLSEARVGAAHEAARTEGRLLGARVRVVEPLGDRMDVHLSFGDEAPFLARVPAHDDLPVGGTGVFGVAMDEVHYFEPGPFGANLVRGRGQPADA
jgi:multiple sugar transport system ATP-binding protein